MGLDPGDPRQPDHINGDRLDNRRSNLRLLTHAEQAQNRAAVAGRSSRFRGVWWDQQRRLWVAQVKMQGKTRIVGRFTDELEAATAASQVRETHMPHSNEERHRT